MKHKNIRIGSKIKLLNENGNYNRWSDQVWTVTDLTNDKDANGYDESIYPEYLISCEDLPVSVYEYEIKVVKY